MEVESKCTYRCRWMWIFISVALVSLATYFFVKHNHPIHSVEYGQSDTTCLNRYAFSGIREGSYGEVTWQVSFLQPVYASELFVDLTAPNVPNYVVYHHYHTKGGYYETYMVVQQTEKVKISLTWKRDNITLVNCAQNLTSHYYFNPISGFNYRTVGCYTLFSTLEDFESYNYCGCYQFEPLLNITNAAFDIARQIILKKLIDEAFPYNCIEPNPFANVDTWLVIVVFFTGTLMSILKSMIALIKMDWAQLPGFCVHKYRRVQRLLGINGTMPIYQEVA